ncbi:RloB family protein [Streptomyces sp. NPDC127068]|uniref:RloB family protein n=1 Tax=Streptomyces sp. NPDC127068 TaxID=3347127 RepID=UPI003662B93E
MARRGKPLTRSGSSRPEQRRFLIYCEGERTEKEYFNGLRRELKALPVTICIGGTHGEPKSLVLAAVRHKERAARSAADRYTAYDEVWCVVDVEAPRQHPSLDEALALARQSRIKVALTNPCFELWLLLHFADVSAYRTSAEVQRAAEKGLACGYTVEKKQVDYERLCGPQGHNYTRARTRARAMRAGNPDGRRVNPWTDVDELVELLRRARARPGNR